MLIFGKNICFSKMPEEKVCFTCNLLFPHIYQMAAPLIKGTTWVSFLWNVINAKWLSGNHRTVQQLRGHGWNHTAVTSALAADSM